MRTVKRNSEPNLQHWTKIDELILLLASSFPKTLHTILLSNSCINFSVPLFWNRLGWIPAFWAKCKAETYSILWCIQFLLLYIIKSEIILRRLTVDVSIQTQKCFYHYKSSVRFQNIQMSYRLPQRIFLLNILRRKVGQ